VSFRRSLIRIRQVSDGTSKTYLVGEQYRPIREDRFIHAGGRMGAWCSGFGLANSQTASNPPLRDSNRNTAAFGSAHAVAFHVAYCDGSVRAVDYDVDLRVHQAGANRHDGMVLGN
jgi:hypothetical protein